MRFRDISNAQELFSDLASRWPETTRLGGLEDAMKSSSPASTSSNEVSDGGALRCEPSETVGSIWTSTGGRGGT